MNPSCCDSKNESLEILAKQQAKVLWVVLWINAVMFFVELGFGIFSESVALVGDSLDMLGDTLAYASSIYVLRLAMSAKAKAARFKATLMVVLGFVVLGRAIYRSIYQVIPNIDVMGSIGFLALAANLFCLLLLNRHKNDDVNMSSVWICSSNDIIANSSVLVAAAIVYFTKSPWPDLIVGFGITILFLRSAIPIFYRSNAILKS